MKNSYVETGLEVAIVGMSGRFPQANNVEQFWDNLVEQRDCISRFDRDTLLEAGLTAENVDHPDFVPAKGVVENVYQFDPSFFGYSARESEMMDPQVRAFHQLAYHALENAGYAPENCPSLVGVYAGAGNNPFWMARHLAKISRSFAENYEVSSLNGREFLATRAAYKLNLKGPAVTVQTACSTSLVAVHHAVSGLLAGECDMALAGGIAVHTSHINGRADVGGYRYQEGMILSPDGHCRAFDAEAQGTVPSDGMGLVVLKRLEDAVKHGDNILAVIKGSAINNDGNSKIGYTAPSVEGQARVIRSALQFADVEPSTVSYIEAHGTGTPLGDPIEIAALKKVYGDLPPQSVAIGSVKTNIGHLDAAAGIAGLIKVVKALQNEKLPASLNFQQQNPKTDLSNSPFRVNQQLADWQSDMPLRAAVSSFGIGGTNAHMILEQYQQPELASQPVSKPLVFTWSAKTEQSAQSWQEELKQFLKAHPTTSIEQIAHTLLQGRDHHEYRRMLVAQNREELLQLLDDDSGAVLSSKASNGHLSNVFMFSGQGSQFLGMAQQLYLDYPVFKAELDPLLKLAQEKMSVSLEVLLFDSQHSAEREALINRTDITQPLLFMVEYATAKLLMSFGVKPDVMVGHSLGEYVAACLSGVIKVEDAIALVVERGRLMASTETGAMLSVALGEAKITELLTPALSLAAVNSSKQCVVSGNADAIEKFEQALQNQDVSCTRLKVSNGYHSYLMEPILAEFEQTLAQVKFNSPTIPYYSNVTGELVTAEQVQSTNYWVQHLRGCVRFNDALTNVLTNPEAILIEVGPGRALSTFAKQHESKDAQHLVVNALRHIKDQHNDTYKFLQCLGRLHLKGVAVDFKPLFTASVKRRLPLPGYAFAPTEFLPEPVESLVADSKPEPSSEEVNLYQPEWRLAPLDNHVVPAEQTESTSNVALAFVDEQGVVESAANQLCQQQDKTVITVVQGSAFERLAPDHYCVNPAVHRDFELLIDELVRLDKIPDTLIHGWALDDQTSVSAEQQLDNNFYSIVFLAQTVAEKLGNAALTLTLTTRQRFNISGSEAVDPMKALVQGPLRVIAHEFANIKTRAIDFGASSSERAHRLESAQLCRELQLFASNEAGELAQQVAFRAAKRWQLDYLSAQSPDLLTLEGYIKPKGTYVITGGLGGIGLTLASHFAHQQPVNLVLVTRRSFPEANEYQSYIESTDARPEYLAAIASIEAMKKNGSTVTVLRADVTNSEDIYRLRAEVKAKFGSVDGIVHAAGLPGGGALMRKQKSDMEAILAAKVQGTELLLEAFTDQSLDFMVLCSSVTAILGGFGQVDYSAANAYLDAFAQAKSLNSDTRVISINWDNWQEVGMAADPSKGIKVDLDCLGQAVESDDIAFSQTYRVETQWALSEHWILGVPTLPGTSYLNMVTMALDRAANIQQFSFKDIAFLSPLALNQGEHAQVTTQLTQTAEGYDFVVRSEEHEHAKGRVVVQSQPSASTVNLQQLIDSCDERIIDNPEEIAHLGKITTKEDGEAQFELVEFGERWQNLDWIRLGDKQGIAKLSLPEKFAADFTQVPLHPALLDCATAFLRPFHYEGVFLPLSYDEMRVYHTLPDTVYSHASLVSSQVNNQKGVQSFDVTLLDSTGRVLVEVKRFTLREVDQSSIDRSLSHKQPTEGKSSALDALRGDGLTNAAALAAFDQVMKLDSASIVVSEGNINHRIDQYDDFLKVQTEKKAKKSPRPELDVAYVKPKTEVEIKLAGILQEIMALETVGVQDDFFELGGDSLLLVQFHKKLQDSFTQKVAMTDLYELTTIKKLAVVLSNESDKPKDNAVKRAVSRVEKQKSAMARRRPSRRPGRG
ncbi:SDR family NAD(P)-dependent oxidoreductase [Pseudoalteromonas luteoviolacea]|uniref:Uncharacterized protein n=1 Tax=Pseudoalteromonas luteoviolacea S4054 TaxID=1129367 RepID=A0A0F6AD33_9GAMM|nr:type I polyketide synthase [Pseudoalteromonas luteoviolacea]AOT10637.1 hypothetical protein S4054249_22515 [Pseudoalteromonas luteoviolacea]AOT15295.1 hypothetical protein S40542_21080 [Pseudoalteromonas luteoviolacea]AOT20456.1 hypothetical protein S4054_22430 [Pseudoalteromonas luteoviolacea]KKE83736.1 hypothetical protein N479_12985 [Pseudoalteromonas luteoviolacea S4054]KZN71940.1 hypothetical protein N481_17350 [Pseudoalteromonas luteoviolacea S4047-1]